MRIPWDVWNLYHPSQKSVRKEISSEFCLSATIKAILGSATFHPKFFLGRMHNNLKWLLRFEDQDHDYDICKRRHYYSIPSSTFQQISLLAWIHQQGKKDNTADVMVASKRKSRRDEEIWSCVTQTHWRYSLFPLIKILRFLFVLRKLDVGIIRKKKCRWTFTLEEQVNRFLGNNFQMRLECYWRTTIIKYRFHFEKNCLRISNKKHCFEYNYIK